MGKLTVFSFCLLLLTGCSKHIEIEKNNNNFDNIIIKRGTEMGISPEVTKYVAMRESRMNCSAYNSRSGASGPLQIMIGSARAFGFTGHPSQLRTCGAGLHYGLLHVKMCVNKHGQNPKRVAQCHESPGSAWNHR
jgi:hypothetical protein